MNLTPYDTGEIAEPHLWMTSTDVTRDRVARSTGQPGETDRYGRVDFDNDESSTVATVWASRNQDGSYTLHVTGEVTIEHDEREV